MTDGQDTEAVDPAEQMRRDQLRDIRTLLEIPPGRRVLSRILERTGPLRQTFAMDSERLSSLAAGERNIGLWILAEIADAFPEAVGQIMTDLQKPNRLDDVKT